MPYLTQKEKRDFAAQMVEIGKKAEPELLDRGFDPSDRIAALAVLHKEAQQKGASHQASEAAVDKANRAARTSTDTAYRAASDTKNFVVGLLGTDHPDSEMLSHIRRQGMTDSEKRDFVTQILEYLRKCSSLFVAHGFDPADRIAELEALGQGALTDVTHQTVAKADAIQATKDSTGATDTAYKEADNFAELIMGLLGPDHPLSIRIRRLRRKNKPPPPPDGDGGDTIEEGGNSSEEGEDTAGEDGDATEESGDNIGEVEDDSEEV